MKCRILVQVWCEIDPTLNLRIDRQTTLPIADDGDALMRVSPLGRFGIAEALRLDGAEVTAFALGQGEEEALRHALAGGAARAVQLRFEEPSIAAATVAGLAGWLLSQSPDLVIADRLAGQVAARLGWAHLAGLDRLQVGNGILTAYRPSGRGAFERVTGRMPAIVRLQAGSAPVRYVARARISQAADRAVETISIRTLPQSAHAVEIGPLQVSRPRTRLGAAPAASASAKASDRLNALMGLGGRAPDKSAAKAAEPVAKTPGSLAEEFVRYLAHHDLLGDP